MKLFITDHRFSQVHLKPQLTLGSIYINTLLENLPQNLEIEIVTDLQHTDFAIIHYGLSALNQLDTSKNLENCPDLQILFCVTTDYKNGPIGYSEKDRKHQKITSGYKIRYVLYGRRLDELNKPETLGKVLKAFLNLTPQQADAIVNKDIPNIPKDLIDIFHPNRSQYLSSLSLLCQAYLATHSPDQLPGFNQLSDKSFLNSNPTHQNIFKKSSWWTSPFPLNTSAELKKQIQLELGKKQLPQDIDHLIDGIYKQQVTINPDIVQSVYDSIHRHLTHN